MHKTILGTETLSNQLQIRPTGESIKKKQKKNNLSLPVFGLLKTHKYCLHWNVELCLCMSKAAWCFSQCCKIFPVSDSNVV